MALEKRNINISFAQGVDTKSDPKQVIPGKLLTLENAVFQKTNSLIKRNGYAALAQGSNTRGVGLSTFKDQLFMLSGQDGYNYRSGRVYSPTQQRWSQTKGYYEPVEVSRVSAGSCSGITAPYVTMDSCVSGNLQFIVYTKATSSTAENLFYAVRDLTTNAFLVQDQPISSVAMTNIGSYIKTVKLGNNFWIIFSATISGVTSLYYIYVSALGSLTTPSSPTTIVTAGTSAGNYRTNSPFDAVVSNNILYLSYTDGSTYDLSLKTINTSFSISATTTVSGMNALNGSTIAADSSGNLWFASCSTSTPNVKVTSYTANLAAQRFSSYTVETSYTGRSTIVGIMDPTVVGRFWIYWNDTAGANEYTDPSAVNRAAVDYTGSTVSTYAGPGALLQNAAVYGKPYIYNNMIKLLVICHDQYAAYSYYIIDGTSAYCEAKLAAGAANPLRGNPVGMYEPTTANYNFIAIEKNTDSNGYILYAYNISYDHKPVFAELANTLHITGGFLYAFDGANLCEHGFLVNPTQCTAADTGAGSVGAGTYYYQFTYEWVDAYGQLHISAPSTESAALTVAASRAITLTIPCLNLTNRLDYGGNKVYIGVYRSSDGTIFYKNRYTGVNGAIVNNQFAATVTYVDSYSFATAYQGQPLLYTVGGEVENVDPGAVKYVATYNQRLIAIPSEAPSTWWYSKEITVGSLGNAGSPVYFSDSFISVVDERSGGINGVLQLDDKIVFFKRNNVFALSGNGPAPDGSGNDFNPPQVIATDTGCIEGQSLVLGPSGIMFKSAKGIYLIDRSLSVSYIGAPVEAYNSVEVVSADLIYNLNQFRFGLSTGVALVYNYLFDQWSVFTNHAIVQACIYQNKYTFVKSSAVCWQENSGYYDDTDSIIMKLTTSWLSFAELQGFQRVYKLMLLGEYKSSHQLQVKVYYDFVDTATQTTSIGVFNTPPYMYRLFLSRQKCTSIKFTIEDTGVAVTESLEISAMAFEVGVKRGLNKLAATRSAG